MVCYRKAFLEQNGIKIIVGGETITLYFDQSLDVGNDGCSSPTEDGNGGCISEGDDVVYDSTSETFSKDLKQSPKIIKKFPN